MKINPKTLDLYTDSGEFLKQLYCPLKKSWGEMEPMTPTARMCDSCSRVVHDTSLYSDEELVSLMAKEPGACLKVTPVQENCTVLPLLE